MTDITVEARAHSVELPTQPTLMTCVVVWQCSQCIAVLLTFWYYDLVSFGGKLTLLSVMILRGYLQWIMICAMGISFGDVFIFAGTWSAEISIELGT